jgi:hypothetical protein
LFEINIINLFNKLFLNFIFKNDHKKK